MRRVCLKCGYEDPSADEHEHAACKQCGAIYSKVEKFGAAAIEQAERLRKLAAARDAGTADKSTSEVAAPIDEAVPKPRVSSLRAIIRKIRAWLVYTPGKHDGVAKAAGIVAGGVVLGVFAGLAKSTASTTRVKRRKRNYSDERWRRMD